MAAISAKRPRFSVAHGHSNVLARKLFGIPVRARTRTVGVMSFDSDSNIQQLRRGHAEQLHLFL